MNADDQYLMENPEEAARLDVKTDPYAIREQARLFGISSGARVLDAGCGSGKTTSILHEIVQPGGSIIGIDFAQDRICFAKQFYETSDSIEFLLRDVREPLTDLGQFDFIWIRFVLEYYNDGSLEIVRHLMKYLKPDGLLCLLDLDNNCLSHYPIPSEMETVLQRIMQRMTQRYNFDPFVGRKLYSYLYDLGFRDIHMHLIPHHLIYGELKSSDDFNWLKKVQMASVKATDIFEDYPGGYDAFFKDFSAAFHDPRRFTYTPLILCAGKKPL